MITKLGKRIGRKAIHLLQKRKAKDTYFEWLSETSALCDGFENKRILDVGGDTFGNMIQCLSNKFNAKEVIGLNLEGEDTQFSSNCKIVRGDIRNTSFEDGYFDFIISCAAFEHIQNIDVALKEMNRILKPGGYVFADFGPIWSSSYGHHLWIWEEGECFNYWNVILPPFAHLLMGEKEVKDILLKNYKSKLADKMVEFIFKSPNQNHLFYEDYERSFKESPFEVIFLKGCDTPGLSSKYKRQITPRILDALTQKYPGKNHFMEEGITTLLRKPISH